MIQLLAVELHCANCNDFLEPWASIITENMVFYKSHTKNTICSYTYIIFTLTIKSLDFENVEVFIILLFFCNVA